MRAAQPLAIEIHRLGGTNGSATFLTRISGAVTTPSARLVEHRFARFVATVGSSARVLLDLDGVTLVDSAGLEVLLDMHRRIIDSGGEFELLDPSATVVTMLHDAATGHVDLAGHGGVGPPWETAPDAGRGARPTDGHGTTTTTTTEDTLP